MNRAVALAGAILVTGSALFTLGRLSVVPSSPRLSPIVERETFIPEPKPLTIRGRATHFDAQRGGQSTWYTRAKGLEFYGAAGPQLRKIHAHEWRGKYRVIVTSQITGRAVIVWIVDWCECRGGDKKPGNDRLVDLAPAVWYALDVPLWRGVTPVSIKLLP